MMRLPQLSTSTSSSAIRCLNRLLLTIPPKQCGTALTRSLGLSRSVGLPNKSTASIIGAPFGYPQLGIYIKGLGSHSRFPHRQPPRSNTTNTTSTSTLLQLHHSSSYSPLRSIGPHTQGGPSYLHSHPTPSIALRTPQCRPYHTSPTPSTSTSTTNNMFQVKGFLHQFLGAPGTTGACGDSDTDIYPTVRLPPVEVVDVEQLHEKRDRAMRHLVRLNHLEHSVLYAGYRGIKFHNHIPHVSFVGFYSLQHILPTFANFMFSEERGLFRSILGGKILISYILQLQLC